MTGRQYRVEAYIYRGSDLVNDVFSVGFLGLASAAAFDGRQKLGVTVIAAQRGRG